MDPATNCLLVYMTAPTPGEAEAIAEMLVQQRLASGVNMVRDALSMYWWAGAVQKESEVLLLAQTTYDRFPELERAVRAIHSYEVPCIIGLPMATGNFDYLKWVEQETTPKE